MTTFLKLFCYICNVNQKGYGQTLERFVHLFLDALKKRLSISPSLIKREREKKKERGRKKKKVPLPKSSVKTGKLRCKTHMGLEKDKENTSKIRSIYCHTKWTDSYNIGGLASFLSKLWVRKKKLHLRVINLS